MPAIMPAIIIIMHINSAIMYVTLAILHMTDSGSRCHHRHYSHDQHPQITPAISTLQPQNQIAIEELLNLIDEIEYLLKSTDQDIFKADLNA